MGWKGTLRSFNASVKRREREAQINRNAQERQQRKLHRELTQIQAISDKREQLDRAKEDVFLFEDYVDSLITLHKKGPQEINWADILISPKPKAPCISYKRKQAAIEEYENFRPTVFQKLLRRSNKIKSELQQKIILEEEKDKQCYLDSCDAFNIALSDWKYHVELSEKVLNLDKESFKEVIESKGTLLSFCSRKVLEFDPNDNLAMSIYINGQDVIPVESKSLLKTGKVSIKSLSKTKYNELYQDHVCSMAFRAAKEVFALLPTDKVIVTIFDHILDQSTGYLDDKPILSILVVKETLRKLNLDSIDPSDALINFKHNMSFKKMVGFNQIDILEYDI